MNKTKNTDTIVSSGEMREFSTGAHRDAATNKGRCDLLPLSVLAMIERNMSDESDLDLSVWDYLSDIQEALKDKDFQGLLKGVANTLAAFALDEDTDIYTLYLNVSYHYKAGAEKYGANNWQKGMPTNVYFDSAIRHYLKFLRSDEDECHDRAFVWNLLGLV